MLSVERINSLETMRSLEDEWNRLIAKNDIENLFSTFDYCYAWWKHYGSANNLLFILVARDSNKIVGIAPLMTSVINMFGFRVRKVAFLAPLWGSSDLIVEQNREEECIRLFMKYILVRSQCHFIELLSIPMESKTITILKNIAQERRLPFHTEVSLGSSFLPIQGSWDTFLKSQNVKFRKTCRGNLNRLERLGPYRVLRITKSNDVASLIKLGLEMERSRWENERRARFYFKKENVEFWTEIAERCNRKGLLDFSYLELNNKPIAYLMTIRIRNKVYALSTSYNENFAAASPGFAIFYFVIKQLFSENNRVKELDFLTHKVHPYIRRWTKKRNKVVTVTLYNTNPISRIISKVRPLVHTTHLLNHTKEASPHLSFRHQPWLPEIETPFVWNDILHFTYVLARGLTRY